MRNPEDVGDHTTLPVMLALHESGYQVATSFGENTRYDLILDDGERLLRVQCRPGACDLTSARTVRREEPDRATAADPTPTSRGAAARPE